MDWKCRICGEWIRDIGHRCKPAENPNTGIQSSDFIMPHNVLVNTWPDSNICGTSSSDSCTTDSGSSCDVSTDCL